VGNISYKPPDPNQFHKVMLFVDGSNMIHSSQRFSKGFKIDYGRLKTELVGNRQLVRPHFFASYDSNKIPEPFYDALRSLGYEVTVKPKRDRIISGKQVSIEKGVDVALVTKMLTHAFQGTYDVAILVSGDSDYVEAMQVVKDRGKTVEIAGFKGSVGKELRRVADKFIFLDDIADKIKIT
jgi:uncharacterized LabA/DUF88 family protein